jgi:hypothetical protein
MKSPTGIPGWIVIDEMGSPTQWFATRKEARDLVRLIGCGIVIREGE